ncbi:hypothetical protein MKY88_12795 [Lysinibacillus sp. FSL R7-0073]|uniref:hypothetical protein n=1 Tax=Lysinibacillus TaxID=400634 RepID=UPI00046A964F|nr:hypothetical protein [Lysinibacillus fusiformis]MBD8521427.1 hypothetical protein [Lysinibacillus fusiformis]MED4886268.1 hypothetical protein [Lysinibacillus fusiformis]UXJ67817.1 hypothetical protein N5069_16785 [Lysinibacillus fusiformis]
MATYIVNTGPNKEVHRTAFTVASCKISEISPSHRVDTDTDYTVAYPNEYDGCAYCYPEKHRK